MVFSQCRKKKKGDPVEIFASASIVSARLCRFLEPDKELSPLYRPHDAQTRTILVDLRRCHFTLWPPLAAHHFNVKAVQEHGDEAHVLPLGQEPSGAVGETARERPVARALLQLRVVQEPRGVELGRVAAEDVGVVVQGADRDDDRVAGEQLLPAHDDGRGDLSHGEGSEGEPKHFDVDRREAGAVVVEVAVVDGVVMESGGDLCFDSGKQFWVTEDEADHPGAQPVDIQVCSLNFFCQHNVSCAKLGRECVSLRPQ